MPEVVAVRLRYNPKSLWFDPSNTSPEEGDHVVVETERGTEIGLVAAARMEVSADDIKQLPSPIKRVIRIADDRDLDKADELDQKAAEALPIFRELIEKYELDMKPVNVEYLFGGEKMVFYFASDGRIDFRELVRELASIFHTRVDMRQIGARDEARMVGGIAHCGEELCCTRMDGEFQPVSIRMAKEQDLPLNPLKISGLCGRLMCCLRYEFEAYKDFKGRAPKKGSLIETPLGLAKVVEFDTPREIVGMRLEDGKTIQVPLAKMDCGACEGGEQSGHPCKVSREVLDECASSNISLALSALDRANEEIADEAAASARPYKQRDGKKRPHKGDGQKPQAEGSQQAQGDKPTPRKRRRGSGSGQKGKAGEQTAALGEKQKQEKKGASARGGRAQQNKKAKASQAAGGNGAAKPRPGQNSSGIRGNASQAGANQAAKPSGDAHRKPRRRHPANDNTKAGS